jgi:hypothetical protein
MIYQRILIISIIAFALLATANVIVISQSSTRQVGFPVCEIYTETGGNRRRCARIYCDASAYSVPSQGCYYIDVNGNRIPTSPRDQADQLCENGVGACTVLSNERIACNLNQKSAEFGITCPDGSTNTVTSRIINCPITCPGCPTPGSGKPCRRAYWDTTYCKWDRSPCDIGGGECLSGLTTLGEDFKDGDSADICSPCNPDPAEVFMCQQGGGVYDWSSCFCGQSPIVIDVLGNGFNLTNYTNGVNFDITGDGNVERLAWTSVNSDDAWLALDRNVNGTIGDGKELFGNSTAQPTPPQGEERNGFLALAEFDKSANGGNNDGKINQQDTIFQSLRLWQDANHNGVSEVGELKTLAEVGLRKIELDYKESRRTDEHGNKFKYRAKVKDEQDAQLGRWAWDVYLAVQPRQN